MTSTPIVSLREACEHAEAMLRDGGVFPIKGQTWKLLHDALQEIPSETGEAVAIVISEGMDHRAMIERLSECPVGTKLYAAPQAVSHDHSKADRESAPAVAARNGQFDKQETPRTDALVSRHTEETDRTYALLPPEQRQDHALRQARELLEHTRKLERELTVMTKNRDAAHDDFLRATGLLDVVRRELAALRLLEGMDALEASALGMFLKGGDIPNTIDAARGALVRRALEAEKAQSATLTIEDAVLALLKLQKLPHDPRLCLPPNQQAYNDALRDAEHAIRSYVNSLSPKEKT